MDLFEFTEALRRQKWVLLVGVILLAGLVAFLILDFEDGVSFRAKPRYESSIQMAVVPAGFDSLASTLPNAGAVAGTASLYATLLASPEAAIEVSEQSGVELLEPLLVTSSGRDGLIRVGATAHDPEGAQQGALHAFTWLEQRLIDPLTVVRVDEPETVDAAPSILAEDGTFFGAMRVDASPAFAESAAGVWVSITTAENESAVAFSLADAAIRSPEYVAVLEPGGELMISLEDVFGSPIDAIVIPVPEFPGPDTVPYALTIRLDRGALDFPTLAGGTTELSESVILPDPELVDRHIEVNWQQTAPVFGPDEEATSLNGVGLLLLTENPVAFVTGARRGPVLMLAALVGGLFALIALAVIVDTWSQARREGKGVRSRPLTAEQVLGIEDQEQAGGEVRELR